MTIHAASALAGCTVRDCTSQHVEDAAERGPVITSAPLGQPAPPRWQKHRCLTYFSGFSHCPLLCFAKPARHCTQSLHRPPCAKPLGHLCSRCAQPARTMPNSSEWTGSSARGGRCHRYQGLMPAEASRSGLVAHDAAACGALHRGRRCLGETQPGRTWLRVG